MKLTRTTRTAGWLAVAGLLGAALIAPTATFATHVTPTPINSGNPTCADFNASWTELKVEPPANGVYSDGTLTVTIAGFQQSVSGTPGSFDWSSNIGVDAVFVKAGSDKHNLYTYSPEATSDTDLGPQAGQGNGISHISFCYDVDAVTTTTDETTTDETTTDETTTDETTTDETTTDEETTESETTSQSTTTTATGTVSAETGDPTPPSTDTVAFTTTSGTTGGGWSLILIAMAGLLATVLLLTPATARSKR